MLRRMTSVCLVCLLLVGLLPTAVPFAAADALPQGTLPAFPDQGSVSDYALVPLAWACSEGLINGVKEETDTYLRPQDSATRAQVAAILMRYMERPHTAL